MWNDPLNLCDCKTTAELKTNKHSSCFWPLFSKCRTLLNFSVRRVWRSPKGWGQNQGRVLPCTVRGQQLPRSLGLSVGAHCGERLRRGAHLPDLWDRGGGRLRLRLHGAVWRSRHQVSTARTLLWLRGKNIFLITALQYSFYCSFYSILAGVSDYCSGISWPF